MKLDSIVPWGRSCEEYRSMFNLIDSDLKKSILGCSDGPASFNAELTKCGGNVVSADPVYQFSAEQIRHRISEVYPQIMSQMKENADSYIWTNILNVAELGQVRMTAMQLFLSDYEAGQQALRYVNASLPALPFDDRQFELALCSHFLFLYSDHFDLALHLQGMKELCRVADEVRVYPLLSLDGRLSRHLSAVIDALAEEGIHTSLQTVRYQFQRGATKMLVAKSASMANK